MSDPSSQPTQPITEDEPLSEETIARARELVETAGLPPGSLEPAVSLLEDMVDEVSRLRAENTAQAAQVAVARSELQRCMGRLEPYARELKAAGNTDAGVPIGIAVGVLRLALERIDEAGQSALGLDQDGRGNA